MEVIKDLSFWEIIITILIALGIFSGVWKFLVYKPELHPGEPEEGSGLTYPGKGKKGDKVCLPIENKSQKTITITKLKSKTVKLVKEDDLPMVIKPNGTEDIQVEKIDKKNIEHEIKIKCKEHIKSVKFILPQDEKGTWEKLKRK